MSARRKAVAPRLAALLLMLLLAAPAHAQDAPRGAADLGGTLDSLASLWSRGDASGVVLLVSATGLSIELNGQPLGPLPPRLVAATLRRMFEQHETVAIRTGMVERVAGEEDRAFGELAWLSRPSGATVPTEVRIFLALVREDGVWRLTQIRILP